MTICRYFAAAGPPQVLRAFRDRLHDGLAQIPDMHPILDVPGLAVFTDPATPALVSAEPGGALIGWLFRSADGKRVERLSTSFLEKARATLGSSVTQEFWGGYVLVAGDGDERHIALRDPSGAVPAYWSRVGGVDLYYSDADLLEQTGLVPPELDLDFARHWLSYPYLRCARTGLQCTRELLAGTVRDVCKEEAQLGLGWSPWRHALGSNPTTDFEQSANALRKVALRTIPKQAAVRPLVLQLSGGLDSSIIAACLAHAGLAFEAVNYATLSPDGDERRHARAVSGLLEIPLAEFAEDSGAPDFLALPNRSFRPGINPVLQQLQSAIENHAAKLGAPAVLDGAGGDNLFCYLQTAAPVLDAWRALGPAAAMRTLRDIATLGGCTIWKAGTIAWRKHRNLARRPYWRSDPSFLMPDAVTEIADRHPWLDAPPGTPIGTREHVEAIVHIQHFLDRRSSALVPALHPLLAQPMMELCLGIPTWLWVHGGRDRAVARAAFKDLLPKEVLDRRVKGSLESLFLRAFAKSRTALADLLLAGELRAAGILDATAVEIYLRQPGELADGLHVRLTEIAALELWLQSWRR